MDLSHRSASILAWRRVCLLCLLLLQTSPSLASSSASEWTAAARTATCRSGQRTAVLRSQFLFLQSLVPRGGSQSTPPNAYDDKDDDKDDEHRKSVGERRLPLRPPPPSPPSRQRPSAPKPSTTATSAASAMASSMAQSSLSLAQKALLGAARQSSRAAVHLARSKSVHLHELHGLWRLDQDIVVSTGGEDPRSTRPTTLPSSLTLEILVGDSPSKCRIRIQHPSYSQPTSFSPSPPPAWTTTEGTFQPSSSRLSHAMVRWIDPQTKLEYSASIQRKWADPSILKLRGKVYYRRVDRRSSLSSFSSVFGGSSSSSTRELIGTFVARRRLRLNVDNENGEDDPDSILEEEKDEIEVEEEGEDGEDDGS